MFGRDRSQGRKLYGQFSTECEGKETRGVNKGGFGKKEELLFGISEEKRVTHRRFSKGYKFTGLDTPNCSKCG